MPIVVVQSISATNAPGGATTVAASFGTLPTAGNAVIAIWSSRSAVALSTVGDNQSGNTYSSVIAATSSPNGTDSEIWWLPSVVGSTGTFTVTGTLGSSQVAVLTLMEVSGLTGVVDQTGTETALGSKTTVVCTASGANAHANELVVANLCVGYLGSASGTSNPCTSSYTSIEFLDGNGSFSGVCQTSYKIVSAIETSSATWTATSNIGNAGCCASIATFTGVAGTTATIAWIT